MIAVLGLDKDTVFAGCDKVRAELEAAGKVDAEGKVLVAEPANFNCPGQITVSGDAEAVDMAAEVLKEMGAKRCLPVKVSGPFHTSLMKPAGDALAERFQNENFGEMNIPVIFNCIGREKTAEETIPALLEKQVQKSVYFDDSIKAINSGVTDKYELFVIVQSVKDAYRLMTETKQIHSVVLGGTKATSETRSISKAVNLTEKEIDLVKDLIEKDYEVEIRMVPTEKKILAKDVI